jgi:hypothetical protein
MLTSLRWLMRDKGVKGARRKGLYVPVRIEHLVISAYVISQQENKFAPRTAWSENVDHRPVILRCGHQIFS